MNRNNGLLLGLCVLVLFGLLIIPVNAYTTQEVCCDIPLQPLTWRDDCQLPKFDASTGILTGVTVNLESCGYENYKLDSEDPWYLGIDYTVITGFTTYATFPDATVIPLTPVSEIVHQHLCPDDEPGLGNPDYAGCDYMHFEDGTPTVPLCDTDNYIGNPADWSGAAGDLVTLNCLAQGDSEQMPCQLCRLLCELCKGYLL